MIDIGFGLERGDGKQVSYLLKSSVEHLGICMNETNYVWVRIFLENIRFFQFQIWKEILHNRQKFLRSKDAAMMTSEEVMVSGPVFTEFVYNISQINYVENVFKN